MNSKHNRRARHVSLFSAFCASLLLMCATGVQAHHSYADYERDEHYSHSGTITDVSWANPHILLTVDSGVEVMVIEWVTTAGADRTGVARGQFAVGDNIQVIGSRNRNPEILVMTLIKELDMPRKNWHWISPSLVGSR